MKWTVLAFDDRSCEALATLLLRHSMDLADLRGRHVLEEQLWTCHLADLLIPADATAESAQLMEELLALAKRRLASERYEHALATRKLSLPGDLAWIAALSADGKLR